MSENENSVEESATLDIEAVQVVSSSESEVPRPRGPRHLRAPIEIRVEITQNSQSFTTTTRDLAAGGVSFESSEQFPIGTPVNVLLYIPEEKELELLKVASEVVWIEEDLGCWMVGAAFRKFAPGDQKRLREWLLEAVRAFKEGRIM